MRSLVDRHGSGIGGLFFVSRCSFLLIISSVCYPGLKPWKNVLLDTGVVSVHGLNTSAVQNRGSVTLNFFYFWQVYDMKEEKA